MGRESRRNLNRLKERSSPEARLVSRVTARLGNVSIRHSMDRPPDLPRLSERLVALIAPYRAEATTLRAYQALCAMAVLAWHLSSLPEAEREREIARAVRDIAIPDPGMFRGIVGSLIQRKLSLFPGDTRLIAEYEVTDTAHGFKLVVASMSLGTS